MNQKINDIFPYKISQNKNHIYCVYLTIYSGELLPPFYFGSTAIDKIDNGYHGSISSKKWKDIYRSELKNNPDLFNTIILKTTQTRKFATAVELFIQKQNDVVRSNFFMNESLACINGMFGRDTSGSNNGRYGIALTQKTKNLISKNHADMSGENNPFFEKSHNQETKEQIKNSLLKVKDEKCIYCGKIDKPWHISKYHNDNCNKNPNLTKIMLRCPHCGFESYSKGNMKGYHFDNCKLNVKK